MDDTRPTPTRPAWLHWLLILGATTAAYWTAFDAGFIWDDNDYVTRNPVLRGGSGLWQIWTDPSATRAQFYPLVLSSFWVEFQLWGLSPLGYHIVNVALHAASACVLLGVLRGLAIPGALFASLLFAVHPVHAESVVWITERKNVLSGLFYLLALRAWLRWRPLESDNPADGRSVVPVLLLFAGAMLSKTVACSLPAAILLLIYWRRGHIGKSDWRATAPFFALGLVGALFTTYWERVHVHAAGVEFDLGFVERLLIAARACWFYLVTLLWPVGLSFNYERWDIDPTEAVQWLPVLGTVALLGAVFALRNRIGRAPLVATLFFGGTLLPALGFINVYPMRYSFVADHFQYLASLGPLVLIAAVLARSLGNWRIPARVAAGATLATLGYLTFQQGYAYKDLETLWKHTLQRNPSSWLANLNLGEMRHRAGRVERARKHFDAALDQYDSMEVRVNLGALDMAEGKLDQARTHFERARELGPHRPEPKNNLAYLMHRQGQTDEALALLDSVMKSDPDYFGAWRTKIVILRQLGRKQETLPLIDRTLELRPGWVEAYWFRADTLSGDEAVAAAATAWTLAPTRQDVRDGFLMLLVGRIRDLQPPAAARYIQRIFDQFDAGANKTALARRLVGQLRSAGLNSHVRPVSQALGLR